MQPVAPESPPSSPDSAILGADNPAKRRKKSSKNVIAEPSSSKEAPTLNNHSTINENFTKLNVAAAEVKPEECLNLNSKEHHLLHSLRNGMNVPHMLGNQLNPTSSVAQKMTDTLTAEVEAHGVFSHNSPFNNRSFSSSSLLDN